jgi:multidrug resistance efflux pump
VERRQDRTQVNRTVPSLIRLLAAIAVLVALVYGGAYWLATKVEPVTRDVTITVPNDRFQK